MRLKDRGFILIEMLVVVALLFILIRLSLGGQVAMNTTALITVIFLSGGLIAFNPWLMLILFNISVI